jgi:hypothetical protein
VSITESQADRRKKLGYILCGTGRPDRASQIKAIEAAGIAMGPYCPVFADTISADKPR